MDDATLVVVAARLLVPPDLDTIRRNATLLSQNLNNALGFDAATPHRCPACGQYTGRVVLDAAAAASLLLAELRYRHLAREGFIDTRASAFVRRTCL